jgi:uncharacterized damage-inducible protein DinB
VKKYFIELAGYNIWANDIVHSWLNRIDEQQWEQPLVSSFESIAATALHIAGAETIWLERLKDVKQPTWLPGVFKGNKKELLDLWKSASKNLEIFIDGFDEKKLEDIFTYRRINGQVFQIQYKKVFAHILNHSSYHRGQLVTLLRQVGFTDLGSTDLTTFYLK